jgi:hypothetical protein
MLSLQALADPDRLRIAALIADQALTTAEIGAALALPMQSVTAHLAMLGRAGLISTSKDRHERRMALNRERLMDVEAAAAACLGEDQRDDAIPASIRQFFREDRLASMPARHARYLEVLAFLANDFRFDKEYPEADVNAMLLRRNVDFATLRRDLVDLGFMTRASGIYRRLK